MTARERGPDQRQPHQHYFTGSDGLFTRVGEHIPLVNKGLQALHEQTGNKAALARAQQKDPMGAQGYLTQAAEFVPVMNNVVQGLHQSTNQQEALERARRRNPFGTDGILTKVGEHIPVLADGIRCIHKFRGHSEAEERARAFSLKKLISRDGAITKLAVLLPGSNLVAAALLEIKGDHKAAEDALNILRQWDDLTKADGALAKIAELFPGIDIIAFGLHANSGNYAQALRSIVKTRWVDVKADSMRFLFRIRRTSTLTLLELEAIGLDLQPRAGFLAGGLADLAVDLFKVGADKSGRARHLQMPRSAVEAPTSLHKSAQEAIMSAINTALAQAVQEQIDLAHETVDFLLDLLNAKVKENRRGSPLMKLLLPKAFPRKLASLNEVIKDALPQTVVFHSPVAPPAAVVEKEYVSGSSLIPAAGGAASCFSFTACFFGVLPHVTAALGCLTGCMAGMSSLGRVARRRAIPKLNQHNVQAWESAVNWPASSSSTSRPGAVPSPSTLEQCVVVEFPCPHVRKAEAFFRRYFGEVYSGTLLQKICLSLEGPLIERLAELRMDTGHTVPLTFDIQLEFLPFLGHDLPKLHAALCLDCVLEPLGPYVSAMRFVIPDKQINQFLDQLPTSLRDMDLRELDPRLKSFTRPIKLDFKPTLTWVCGDQARLEVSGIRSRLHLPE